MKKKSVIVAIVMASMIMGGCGQKTVTSVNEDPAVSEAPTKEDTLEPEESAEDAAQSAEDMIFHGEQVSQHDQAKQQYNEGK